MLIRTICHKWSKGMIKKFGFKNFGSFSEGSEISFELDGKTPLEVSQGMPVGTVLGIKGANGSGKTNILKALTFLMMFTADKKKVDTKARNNEIDIPIDSFFFASKPTEFYIEVDIDGTSYYYELDVKRTGIEREKLTKTVKRESVIFVREKNSIVDNLKSLDELKMVKLKPDQSILTLVDDFSFKRDMQDIKKINRTFKRMITNVNYHGLDISSIDDVYKFSEDYRRHPEALDFMVKILKKADQGIDSVEIQEGKTESGETYYFPFFFHKHQGRKKPLISSSESKGNNVIFTTMFRYYLVLKTGGLLIHDEFDTHLHALILPCIIRLFLDKETNPHNAQLIVTAHNTEIIDSLGRYRTILVNKEENESYCYRLDELSMLRNDRQISPYYVSGKIGGVPTSTDC